MTVLFFILTIQIGSQYETVIPATDQCGSSPDVVYQVGSGWLCIPSDLVFIQGFESE